MRKYSAEKPAVLEEGEYGRVYYRYNIRPLEEGEEILPTDHYAPEVTELDFGDDEDQAEEQPEASGQEASPEPTTEEPPSEEEPEGEAQTEEEITPSVEEPVEEPVEEAREAGEEGEEPAEPEVPTAEEAPVRWVYEEVYVWPPVTANALTSATITDRWGRDHEQKLINDNMAAVMGLCTPEEAEQRTQAYRQFLLERESLRREIDEMFLPVEEGEADPP